MNFTKEQVLEKIQAKLGKTQKISDRSILEISETLMKSATDETELEAFITSIYPIIEVTNRNINADGSEYIKNYDQKILDEKKQLEDRVKELESKNGNNPPQDTNKKELNTNDELTKALEAIENLKKVQEDQQKQYENLLKTKSIEEFKTTSIASAKTKWGEDIVALAEIDFDWSREKANELWEAKILATATKQGVQPISSEGNPPPKDFSKEKERLIAEGKIKVKQKE